MTNEQPTFWMTYQVQGEYPRAEAYSHIGLYDDELQALRYANDNGAKVVDIRPGELLRQAIFRNKKSL